MSLLLRYSTVLVVVFALIFTTKTSFAQNLSNLQILNISLLASPSTAGPNGEITFEVGNYAYASTSEAFWYVDDVLQTGENSYQLTTRAGNFGTSKKIRVDIFRDGKLFARGEEQLVPLEINEVWEGLTFVPYRHKGLPLAGRGSSQRIKLSVYGLDLSGSRITQNDVVFNWRADGEEVFAGEDNTGRDSFVVRGFILGGKPRISVDLYIKPLDITISKYIETPTINLNDLLFYENHPLIGDRHNLALISPARLRDNQLGISLFAYPLDVGGDIDIIWNFAGETQIGTSTVLFKREDDETGTSERVSATARNNRNINQEHSNSILINY